MAFGLAWHVDLIKYVQALEELGFVDRAMLERFLAQGEEHVALGDEHIARQRHLISELRRDGQDTEMAETLLAEFEQSQALHVAHRDRLRRKLAELAATVPT